MSAAAGFALLFAQGPVGAQLIEEPSASTATVPEEGGACDFTKYQSSWDPRQCGSAATVTGEFSATDEAAAAAVPEIAAPEAGGACDFSKYHSSWDPARC